MQTTDQAIADIVAKITDDDISTYLTDGAICLRDIITDDWIEHLTTAIDGFLGGSESNASVEGDTGRYVGDVNLWTMSDDFQSYAFDGPTSHIARALMNSKTLRLFGDQIFVKEPGTTTPTPWHQDQPYWPVLGQDVCSVWVPVDAVTVETSGLEYVAGSHQWGQRFDPEDFGTMSVAMLRGPDTEPAPDFENTRDQYKMLSWDMEPGDCLIHNSLTVHGSGANTSSTQRRRALATRWLGDDATFRPSTFHTTELCRLEAGQPMESPMFPQVPTVPEELATMKDMMGEVQAMIEKVVRGD